MLSDRLSPWFVDPKHVEDGTARQRVQARARELFHKRRRETTRVRVAMRSLHAVVFLLAVAAVVTLALRSLPYAALAMGAVALGMVIAVVIRQWFKRRPFVRLALRELGDERCVTCGHSLRGLPRDVLFCPECGTVRVREVADEALPKFLAAERDGTPVSKD